MNYAKLILIGLSLIGFVFNQFNYTPNKISNTIQLTGEDYITGEDGVPRMNINVWGHVKYPGTYLVYDGIDVLTCLSLAGGPLSGAKLSEVQIISSDGTVLLVDLEKLTNNNSNIKLKPRDTIKLNEKTFSYISTRTNFINTVLQIFNLILISINN